MIGNAYFYDPADIQQMMKSDEPIGEHIAAIKNKKKAVGTD